MSEPTLKPCPWCGGPAEIIPRDDEQEMIEKFFVACRGIECEIWPESNLCEDEQTAADVWNRRAHSPDIAALLAWLEAWRTRIEEGGVTNDQGAKDIQAGIVTGILTVEEAIRDGSAFAQTEGSGR
jgi:hypothetical protein